MFHLEIFNNSRVTFFTYETRLNGDQNDLGHENNFKYTREKAVINNFGWNINHQEMIRINEISNYI